MANERTLNNFASIIKKDGLSRSSRFNVIITKPKLLRDSSFIDNDLILLCCKANLPSITVATNDVQVYGEPRAMPYQKMYEKANLSFYVDINMDIKKFFDRWLQLIIHPISKNHYYYDDYTTDIEIIVNDGAEKPVYKMILKECFPTNINNISLDYADKDIMRLDVSITYKHYEISEFTSSLNYDLSNSIGVSAVNYPTIQNMINNRTSGFGYTANTVNSLISNINI